MTSLSNVRILDHNRHYCGSVTSSCAIKIVRTNKRHHLGKSALKDRLPASPPDACSSGAFRKPRSGVPPPADSARRLCPRHSATGRSSRSGPVAPVRRSVGQSVGPSAGVGSRYTTGAALKLNGLDAPPPPTDPTDGPPDPAAAFLFGRQVPTRGEHRCDTHFLGAVASPAEGRSVPHVPEISDTVALFPVLPHKTAGPYAGASRHQFSSHHFRRYCR